MKMFLRLAAYGMRHKWQMIGAYIAMVGATLAALVIPRFLGTAIDVAIQSGVQRDLYLYGGAVLASSVIRGAFSYGQAYFNESVSQLAAYDLRNAFFKKLHSMSFGFHDKQQTGNLMAMATSDVDAVRSFIGSGLMQWLSTIITLVGVAVTLISMNPRLGLISLMIIPVVVVRSFVLMQRLNPLWTRSSAANGRMVTILQESLTGMKVVKAFGGRKFEEAKFESAAREVATSTYASSVVSNNRQATWGLLIAGATALIIWSGGHEVVGGALTPGELVAFALYVDLLTQPIRKIGSEANGLARTLASGKRLFSVLDAESPVKERPGAKPMGKVSGHVRFQNVTFGYDPGTPVLKGLDFEAKPGKLVAILGGPGSGKSSVVQLIPRFYDVSSGAITIDGTDIRDVQIESLRENVGIVLQDVFLFAATIRENIAYGLADASQDDIERAAKIAQLHQHIESLPAGYDTRVGERGVTLSGGQRQRLAIARTILIDPPIMILDDSTSSVDMGTEYLIQQAMAEVVKGRTTFVIAHRLSTVRKADLIIVLDNGRIAERGTHDELIARDGQYRRIYDLQFKSQKDAEAPVDSAISSLGNETTQRGVSMGRPS
ncbi:MAG: ABC transporter ATP-binding protein [SAR202 cluster bacterium]|nr:ABC transporter ATP-binding protein [SAR202 cluster bacterium]